MLAISGVIFSLIGAALGLWAVRDDLPELMAQVSTGFEAAGIWLVNHQQAVGGFLLLAVALAVVLRSWRPVVGLLRRQAFALIGFQRDQAEARRVFKRYGVECRRHRLLLRLSFKALAEKTGIARWRLFCFRLFSNCVPAHRFLRALASGLEIKEAHFRSDLGRRYGAQRTYRRLKRYCELGDIHTDDDPATCSPQKIAALVARWEKQRWQDLLDEGKVLS